MTVVLETLKLVSTDDLLTIHVGYSRISYLEMKLRTNL